MVSQRQCLVHQIVRVYADAVSADEPWREGQEIPLGGSRLDNVVGVDANPSEDNRELVDEGDIDVALRILYNLSRLGYLDARRTVYAHSDHRFIDCGNLLERLRITA